MTRKLKPFYFDKRDEKKLTPLERELLAALKLALQSGEIDGAKCAMRVLNTIGRRAIAKAEELV